MPTAAPSLILPGMLAVFGEIGLTLLDEGAPALLRLIGGIEEGRGTVRNRLQTVDVIGIGVEGIFQEAQRRWALGQHLATPRLGLFLQLLRWHDFVRQAHFIGLLGCVLSAEVPDLSSTLLADHTGELDRAEAGVEAANLWARLTEFGAAGGDRQIAQHVQDVPTADAIAIHH